MMQFHLSIKIQYYRLQDGFSLRHFHVCSKVTSRSKQHTMKACLGLGRKVPGKETSILVGEHPPGAARV
jgi:hypothetical protein